jgi:hypothetical protein
LDAWCDLVVRIDETGFSISRSLPGHAELVITITTLPQWFTCVRLFDSYLTEFFPPFNLNAHHQGSLPSPLEVVCDLRLHPDHEGLTLLFDKASRRPVLQPSRSGHMRAVARRHSCLPVLVLRRSANLVIVPAHPPFSGGGSFPHRQEQDAVNEKEISPDFAEFARRQAEALAGITEMARVSTRNEGLAKDRALLTATLQIISEKCAAEVNTHMGSLAAISALQWSAGPVEDGMCNPWPFKASIMCSPGIVFPDGFFCLKKQESYGRSINTLSLRSGGLCRAVLCCRDCRDSC